MVELYAPYRNTDATNNNICIGGAFPIQRQAKSFPRRLPKDAEQSLSFDLQ